MRRCNKRTAPGRLGGRQEHWQILQCTENGLAKAGLLLARLALGQVPEDVLAAHARCEVAPITKPGGSSLRPLQLGSVCRRMAMSAVVSYIKDDVQAAVGADQLAIGTQDGCTKAYQALRTKCRLQPQRVVLAEDCASAHQSLDRHYAADKLAAHCPRLLQPFLTWYGRTTTHVWFTAGNQALEIVSERGLDQGDPLANTVFDVSVVDCADALRTKVQSVDPDASVLQFSDDLQVCTTPQGLPVAAAEAKKLWAPAGLNFKDDKRQTWSLSPELLPQPFQGCRVTRLRSLGHTLDQADDATTQTLPQLGAETGGEDLQEAGRKVGAVAMTLSRLIASGLPRQIAQSLFRYAATGQTQHIMAGKYIGETAARAFDTCLRTAWGTVLGIELTDSAWMRGLLPLKSGGCAFGAIEHRAPAAYVACWSRIHDFVSRHAGLGGPGELLQADQLLAAELQQATSLMRQFVPAIFSIPWEHGTPPSKGVKQKTLMIPYYEGRRKATLVSMDRRDAAIFRSCGGPGAGGFLMLQKDPDVIMDDESFKIAVARRLGGGLRPSSGAPMPCQHVGPRGPCTGQIDVSGGHASTCAVGGLVIQRHDRVLRWLHRWLSQGRTSSPPLIEQVLPSENGRLDITFVQEGVPRWVDVAITAATTVCERSLAARAKIDGRAARDEEAVKRSRYHGRAQPFVLEAHGRPGPSAMAFVRAFSVDGDATASESAADAWAALSSVSQSGTARIEISAYGKNALSRGTAEIWTP